MVSVKWDIRNIYLYLVCLITLVIFIFAISSVGSGIVELVYPQPVYEGIEGKVIPEQANISKADLEKQQQLEKDRNKYYATRKIIESGILILVVVPLYMYHWRRIEKDLE